MATFDEAIAARLKAFQQANHLAMTGTAGTETWEKLLSAPDAVAAEGDSPSGNVPNFTLDGPTAAFLEEMMVAVQQDSLAEFFGISEEEDESDGQGEEEKD